MPKNRRQRREDEADWEPSGTEENYVNVSGSNSGSNQVGAAGVGECDDDDSGNDQTNGHANGGRLRHRKSQHKQQSDLAPWTAAVTDTIQVMETAHHAINTLQEMFASHSADLGRMNETRARLTQVEEECRKKDEDMTRLMNTITTLTTLDQKTKDTIDQKTAKLEKEKKELEQEKLKYDKRFTMEIVEAKHKLQSEFKELTDEQERKREEAKKTLEDEFARKRGDNDRIVTDLEANKQQLSATVEEQKRTIRDAAQKVAEVTGQCELLNRAMDSFKKENEDSKMELETMKREFALTSRPTGYFQKTFTEIHGSIESMSVKYFNDRYLDDVDGKVLGNLSKELSSVDSQFLSVPIDDTDDSHDLRAAHAQRIISNAICEIIWKPFRSEVTLLHPEFDELLGKLSEQLHKSNPGGRAANVWTALTTQALESLPVNSVELRVSESSPGAVPSTRTDKVVSEVCNVLSRLVNPSKQDDFRQDLVILAGSAIEVWNNAQSGELRIIVSPSLESTDREEWRSPDFDPVLPSLDHDGPNLDAISRTRPRIMTLFPRVIAREIAAPVKHDNSMPGSWQPESDQAPPIKDTCIHPGRGLPEWSPLVVRGKEAQEQRAKLIDEAMQFAYGGGKTTLRSQGHGRRESRGSMSEVTRSISEQWKMERVRKFSED